MQVINSIHLFHVILVFKKIIILDNISLTKSKIQIIDNLLQIEIAYSLLKVETDNQNQNRIDSLKLKQLFKIIRQGEDERFTKWNKDKNRQLLWHGSRTTNFAGIISQGLRIAPPEAPMVCL